MGSSAPLVLFLFSTSLLLRLHFSLAIKTPIQSLQTISFDQGYTQIFGDSNLMLLRDGKTVHISLDEKTGAGFASQDLYLHGFFSASIKLPADYAAGVVVAFYLSNGDVYEKTHDELDFEFLGNIRGKEWRLQTNVYGNGSTSVGREERYDFWFDPTEDFHQYSILWTSDRIIFYIDNTPIREIVNSKSIGGAFPSKPMSLYTTIWDGSTWATLGGRYKVNYKYAPFVAEFADLILHGCSVDPTDHSSACEEIDSDRFGPTELLPEQRSSMDLIRVNHMAYSYCHDRKRYPLRLTECIPNPAVSHLYGDDGLKFTDRRKRRGKRIRTNSSI